MILVVLLYAVLASTFIFAKNAVAYANPCFLIGFRMIIAGTLLLGYQYWSKGKKFLPHKSDWWLFFKASVFHIYLAFVLEFWALQYISALKTTLIYSATPFIAALLSYVLLHERLSKTKVLGIVIGLGGLVPVLMAQVQGAEASMEFGHISLPEIVLFIAVVASSYAWFIVKQLMAKGYGFGLINGVTMLIGGIMSLATAAVFEGFSSPVHAWVPFLGWVALLIVSANIVVYNLYGYLLHHHSITFLSFAGFLCPSFGTLYEWLFMGGTITWHYLACLVLVTSGLYIFYRDELKFKQLIEESKHL